MTRKLAIGIATIFAVVWIPVFLAFLLALFFSPWKPSDDALGRILMVHFGCVLLLLGLVIYYVRHALHNDIVSAEKKPFWIKAFLLGGVVFMPIYWYLYIFRQNA